MSCGTQNETPEPLDQLFRKQFFFLRTFSDTRHFQPNQIQLLHGHQSCLSDSIKTTRQCVNVYGRAIA